MGPGVGSGMSPFGKTFMAANVMKNSNPVVQQGNGQVCPGIRPAAGRAVQLALVVMACMGSLPAQAKMAQNSLVVTTPPIIEPNVMFTLDDSGSMLFNFLPDKDGPYQLYTFHPQEPDKLEGRYGVRGNLGSETDSLLTARRRSPDVNTLYYNPEVQYLPWMKEDGTREPDADPQAAYFYFNHDTKLRVNLKGVHSLTDGPNAGRVCREMYDPDPRYKGNCLFYGGGTSIPKTVYPATYFRLKTDPKDAKKKLSPDNVANFERHIIELEPTVRIRTDLRTECREVGGGVRECTREQEYQNFANWYQYYRTRYLLAAGAVSEAFNRQLGADVRLGYGRINKGNGSVDGHNTRVVERGVRRFEGDDKKSFFQWVQKDVRPFGGTPLLGATVAVGKYFERADAQGPWADTSKTHGTRYLSCRRSYHILMTDGIYNDGNKNEIFGEVPGATNADWEDGPLIPTSGKNKAYQYKPHEAADPIRKHFASATSQTLGDLAMYFWNRDLQPGIPNNVPRGTGDPSYWQNVTMYTMSFGVGGDLPAGSPEQQRVTLEKIRKGELNWPAKIDAESPAAVDDLWHAAVNGHGRYVNVNNSTEFLASMRQILAEIVDRTGTTAGVAVSSRALQTSNQKFVPSFTTRSRTGNLEAYAISAVGKEGVRQWGAAEKMPHWSWRNVIVGESAGLTAQKLEWTQQKPNYLTQDMKDMLLAQAGVTSGTEAEKAAEGWKLVAYLLGDSNYETVKYNARRGALGQIINSNPVFIGAATNHGYGALPTNLTAPSGEKTVPLGTLYRQYIRDTKGRKDRKRLVMVGSNEGMVHAFDAQTGAERFAYVPHEVAKEMARLANRNVSDERLLMDGPLVETDAYFEGGWKNVVLGTTGAGPAAVFALNMSDTTDAGLGTKTLMWEHDKGTLKELGHVLSAPEVGVLRDGTWVAVFGNGYESASRRARLFVVDLKTGRLLRDMDTGVGSKESPNGLGGVKLLRDGNGVITAAYAGDLLGNLWKFDLASHRSPEWKVAFGGKPMFKSENGRPFTAAPATVTHPRGGVMVLAATGKLFEEGDEKLRELQSAYGLWDASVLVQKPGGSTNAGPGALSGRQLQEWVWQEGQPFDATKLLKREQSLSQGGSFSQQTDPTKVLDWAQHRGWQVPLTMMKDKGLRNIVQPQLVSGQVMFETMTPVLDVDYAKDPCADLVDVPGFTLFLDPLSGGMSKKAVIDTNRDGKINDKDLAVSGWKVENWTGRSVVLTEEPAKPCTTNPCTAQGQSVPLCPAQTLTNIALTAKEATVVCVNLPTPNRWWWRELAIPDNSYSAGKAVDPDTLNGSSGQ